MKNRNILKITLLVISVLILGIVVAYAALSATLNVSFNTITQNKLTWSIGFSGTAATPSQSGTSTTGLSCGNATVTSSTVTVAASTLSKPGDKCTYTLNIANTGDIAAKLTSITPTRPTSTTCGTASGGNMICGNITYKLATNSGGTSLLTTNSSISAKTTSTVYLIVEYNSASLATSAVTQSGAKFTLNYTQA